jgi:hypothetical protein
MASTDRAAPKPANPARGLPLLCFLALKSIQPRYQGSRSPLCNPDLYSRRDGLGGWAPVTNRILAVLGVAGALVGGYFAYQGVKGSEDYTFGETLPKMAEEFGEGAKVVSINVGGSGVHYQVIGDDGMLHDRTYGVQTSESIDGTSRERKVTDSSRQPTAAERHEARVPLGEFDSGVVDELYDKVGFSAGSSSATYAHGVWLLQSGSHPFDKYEASYDGSRLRQTQSQQSTFGTP